MQVGEYVKIDVCCAPQVRERFLLVLPFPAETPCSERAFAWGQLPMTAQQHRSCSGPRDYNQWVANQTLEDYALRFTAKARGAGPVPRVANTAIGGISFLALEAIGGAITISFGFSNATTAILAVSLLIFLTGLPISYYAAKYGVDMDLLTRGAGFGYIGSTITSLIYASFTFIFFALEAAIMALALQMCFGIPLIYPRLPVSVR